MQWLKKFASRRDVEILLTEGTNPIHAWLDAHEVPWRDSQSDLIARFGKVEHSDRLTEAVELSVPTNPIEGLIRPLYVQLWEHFSPNVPATELIGDAYYGSNERANVQKVASELGRYLGPVSVEDYLNTVQAVWTYDRARVRLLAWPRDMQRERSSWEPPDNRDLRLQRGCYISVYTGILIEPTAEERTRLHSYTPICSIQRFRGLGSIEGWGPSQYDMEFIRDPVGFSGIKHSVGMSKDRGALIFQKENLFLIDLADVNSIYVERTRPAKGPGGSRLQVEVSSDCPGVPIKNVTICESKGADDLSGVGQQIAKAVEKPLQLSPYYFDC